MTALEFAAGAERLLTASWDKTVRIWDIVLGRQIGVLSGHNDVVSALAVARNGRWFVSSHVVCDGWKVNGWP